ncbi:MAG: type II toxin-antitoxin system RelE/ParE family toxin [Henriciella sp.]|nr:type II toxin-antitoxin system RelE/ParE family toxin [Henriciella sp.]
MSGFMVSKAANADIRSIARYTQGTWGRDQRRRYLDGLNEKFEVLAVMPEMAAERRDFHPPVRIHHYEKHLIIYVITDNGILIVRVLHQSQDVPAQLSE